MSRIVCISCCISIFLGAKEESNIVCRLEVLQTTEVYPHREKQSPLHRIRQVTTLLKESPHNPALLFQLSDCSRPKIDLKNATNEYFNKTMQNICPGSLKLRQAPGAEILQFCLMKYGTEA